MHVRGFWSDIICLANMGLFDRIALLMRMLYRYFVVACVSELEWLVLFY